ncbi:ExbD/TolR family protein [Roseinatronobacter bogoriensis]|uniref:Biopolymer transporter ExbD n=1 Tax=Roseinatronobacter bogoriensis subsp. barguzinensis TaxID=441209 RepID=A0A2K8K845_9RHOB|nr:MULTISPECIES: biopolymer transporter ExbD [Rhodobaca]ATX65621.1 biopolymer transporter ExbD [Rhodobaca barguzinensis]MBB4208441.1 biopolymer transport protein ExbD [Rhodobaca bogoriensis DSM 18756]TDW39083.1 biopolymer transport protein ExbD [Rhodobaca barguzinensis]TDY66402.1 outer membrane transport energization protein ExbD [Rhodobaca bogoriensis DSM 18756]
MNFAPLPPRKPIRESVVPMINVVFLLLIFFLMSAQIAPPDPVTITPPMAQHADQPLAAGERVAWLDAQGVLYAQGVTGAEALSLLSADPGPLILRADAAMPAALFARVLQDLGAAGLEDVTLVAVAGAP